MTITPYYDQRGITIYCGDCLDVMPQLEPLDVVIADPPYGREISSSPNGFGTATDKSRKATDETWDNEIADPAWIAKAQAISKNQIIFGGNYYLEWLTSTRCYVVWDKRGYLPDVPFDPTEWAWTSFDKMSKKYTVINHGFIRDSKEVRTIHPTQKPLKLMGAIVRDFTKLPDVILDPFMGSGTTLVAAKNEGRRAIGIELSEEYCAIAVDRLRQPSFFSLPVEPKANGHAQQIALIGEL